MFIDYISLYSQIDALRFEANRQARGYKFEQIMREILPWDYRPPIAKTGISEQIDACFAWEGRDYLVECKAKEGVISRGSPDWEDFELKIRKRHGQMIGIFSCLYEVSPDIYKACNDLALQGIYAIIFEEQIWDRLRDDKVDIKQYMTYVAFNLKTTGKFDPSLVKKVKEYFQDKTAAEKIIVDKLSPISGLFLRRHKLDFHDNTYVSRSADEFIQQRSVRYRPSNVKLKKQAKSNDFDASKNRVLENQIILLRDISGAGKTTLAVELATNRCKNSINICRTASDASVDGLLADLQNIGPDFGIDHFVTLDVTLLYIVDSLDEAEHVPGARKAIISLNRSLDVLNARARIHGLIKFPIVIIYTLREEHWRTWDSVFEGFDVYHYKNRFSLFSDIELDKAIKNYSLARNFRFSRPLNKTELDALRSPFDLYVFSETFSYEGEIDPDKIFSQSVLSAYFQRKSESLAVRPIQGLSPDRLIGLSSLLALHTAATAVFEFERDEVYKIFRGEKDVAPENYDRIINILISENIIVRSQEGGSSIRFRHNRFIEYLVSLHFAGKLVVDDVFSVMEELVTISEKSAVLSVISVCGTFKGICRDRYANYISSINEFFSQSLPLLKEVAQKNRLFCARGGTSDANDMDLLEKGLATNDASLAWEVFFIFVSKNNREKIDKIISIFRVSWQLNEGRSDVWKMLKKLNTEDLLFNEWVVKEVMSSKNSYIWLVYLDEIVRAGLLREFVDLYRDRDIGTIASKNLLSYPNADWDRVVWVLDYLSRGQEYPIGIELQVQ